MEFKSMEFKIMEWEQQLLKYFEHPILGNLPGV